MKENIPINLQIQKECVISYHIWFSVVYFWPGFSNGQQANSSPVSGHFHGFFFFDLELVVYNQEGKEKYCEVCYKELFISRPKSATTIKAGNVTMVGQIR